MPEKTAIRSKCVLNCYCILCICFKKKLIRIYFVLISFCAENAKKTKSLFVRFACFTVHKINLLVTIFNKSFYIFAKIIRKTDYRVQFKCFWEIQYF